MIRRPVKLKPGAVVATILLFLYVPSFFGWVSGRSLRTEVIHYGEIREYIPAEAWLIRDDMILLSGTDGRAVRNILEGEMAPAGFPVISVLDYTLTSLLEELQNIEEALLALREQQAETNSLLKSEYLRVSTEFADLVDIHISARYAGDMAAGIDAATRMQNLLKETIIEYGEALSADLPEAASLNERRREVQAEILSATGTHQAPMPGLISYTVDGVEDIFVPDQIDKMDLDWLARAETAYHPRRLALGTVTAGQPYARITKNLTYYLAVDLPYEQAQRLEGKNTVNLRLRNLDKVIQADVCRVGSEPGGRSLVLFRTDMCLADMVGSRKISLDIVLGGYSGLKVPLSSLLYYNEQDGTASIALVVSYRVSMVPVVIRGRDSEAAIVHNADTPADSGGDRIHLYAVYAVDPRNVRDGQTVD